MFFIPRNTRSYRVRDELARAQGGKDGIEREYKRSARREQRWAGVPGKLIKAIFLPPWNATLSAMRQRRAAYYRAFVKLYSFPRFFANKIYQQKNNIYQKIKYISYLRVVVDRSAEFYLRTYGWFLQRFFCRYFVAVVHRRH